MKTAPINQYKYRSQFIYIYMYTAYKAGGHSLACSVQNLSLLLNMNKVKA